MMNKLSLFGQRIDLELFAWVGGLIALFCLDPNIPTETSLCLFKNLGIPFCPGCGLGRSIAFAFQGNWEASFQMHPLGIVTLILLISRIIQLIHKKI